MKRKNLDDKDYKSNYLENVRFFKQMPKDVNNSLTSHQKRVIALTIMDLLRKNPRILKEIYMEEPVADKRPSIFKRVQRRLLLFIRGFVYEIVLQKSERRFGASIADYLFLLSIVSVLFIGVLAVIFILYSLKNLIGIDIFPGIHFFYVD
jgi:hypothetical protein